MTADSLSAVGISGQEKQVRPNWPFITGTFVMLLLFNFGVVGLLVYLQNKAQTKLAAGEGTSTNIYYDKAAAQENGDRSKRSCWSSLFARVNKLGSGPSADEQEKSEPLPKGPRYDDLAQLLNDFKTDYDVLRAQLAEVQEAQRAADDEEELRRSREEALLDERIQALQDLKEFVRENQACLRQYLGLDD
jgi:hypothetical protein